MKQPDIMFTIDNKKLTVAHVFEPGMILIVKRLFTWKSITFQTGECLFVYGVSKGEQVSYPNQQRLTSNMKKALSEKTPQGKCQHAIQDAKRMTNRIKHSYVNAWILSVLRTTMTIVSVPGILMSGSEPISILMYCEPFYFDALKTQYMQERLAAYR